MSSVGYGMVAVLAVLAVLGPAGAGAARAGAPDPDGAVRALLATPLEAAGDACGAAGLIPAALLGGLADGLSLLDDRPATRPILHGIASRPLYRLARTTSQLGTGVLEALRGEDIERLPEPASAYRREARFAGRGDTALSGLASAGLAARDALSGPVLAGLRAAGARAWAERLARWRREARVRALGPEPPPEPAATASAPLQVAHP